MTKLSVNIAAENDFEMFQNNLETNIVRHKEKDILINCRPSQTAIYYIYNITNKSFTTCFKRNSYVYIAYVYIKVHIYTYIMLYYHIYILILFNFASYFAAFVV